MVTTINICKVVTQVQEEWTFVLEGLGGAESVINHIYLLLERRNNSEPICLQNYVDTSKRMKESGVHVCWPCGRARPYGNKLDAE